MLHYCCEGLLYTIVIYNVNCNFSHDMSEHNSCKIWCSSKLQSLLSCRHCTNHKLQTSTDALWPLTTVHFSTVLQKPRGPLVIHICSAFHTNLNNDLSLLYTLVLFCEKPRGPLVMHICTQIVTKHYVSLDPDQAKPPPMLHSSAVRQWYLEISYTVMR